MLNKDEVARALVMIAGISSLALLDCRRVSDSTGRDTVIDELNRIKPAAVRLGVGDRVESVLSMRRNGVVDARPFLVYATLADSNREPTTLALCLYDEDVDVLGLGVQEEHVSSGGKKTTLLEDYPVFVHRPASGAYDYRALPVRIRREGQRKDAELWDHYVTGKEIDSIHTDNPEYYRKTLPPVWMSLPKPNELDVRVYLYDRAGNKSEAICPVIGGHQEQPEGIPGTSMQALSRLPGAKSNGPGGAGPAGKIGAGMFSSHATYRRRKASIYGNVGAGRRARPEGSKRDVSTLGSRASRLY